MLCSARELGVSEESNGLHILADDAPVGQNIREHLKLDDTLFTLKLTPNLAHCLSVQGIAREVSALTGAPLTLPAVEPVKPSIDATVPVAVDASDLCGRFVGRVIQGVNPKAATPDWMVDVPCHHWWTFPTTSCSSWASLHTCLTWTRSTVV